MTKFNRRFLLGISCGLIAENILTGCAALVSGGHKIAVKATDISKFEAAMQLPLDAPLISHPLGKRPLKIYKVAFDGTLNDKSRVPAGERETIVARIANLVKADDYHAGAGMQGNVVDLLDVITGESCKKIAQEAQEKFFAQARCWLSTEPDTEIRVFVTGFSRGAATARHFMNITEEDWGTLAGAKDKLKYLDCPRFFALLYDTVATGQQDRLKLQLTNSVDYLVHFVATDEPRNLFVPTIDVEVDLPPIDIEFIGSDLRPPNRINSIFLPGAHSDIGAAYPDGIGDLYVVLTEQFLYMMGLIETNCWDIQHDPFANGKHDSRGNLDKLFGSPEPNSLADVNRQKKCVLVPHQDGKVKLKAAKRLKELWRSNFNRMAWMTTATRHKLTASFEIRNFSSGLMPLSVSPHIDPASVHFVQKDGSLHMNFRFKEAIKQSNLILKANVIGQIHENGSVLSITYLEAPKSLAIAIFVDDVMRDFLTMSVNSETTLLPRQEHCLKKADGSSRSRIQTFVIEADGAILLPDAKTTQSGLVSN